MSQWDNTDEFHDSQRRIRHITALQVKNFVPLLTCDVSTSPPTIPSTVSQHQVPADNHTGTPIATFRSSSNARNTLNCLEGYPFDFRKRCSAAALPTHHWDMHNNLQEFIESRLTETFITLTDSAEVVVENPQSALSQPSASVDISFTPSNQHMTTPYTKQSEDTSSLQGNCVFDHGLAGTNGNGTSPISYTMAPSVQTAIKKTPFFISSLHRPSTNPSFDNIDPKTDFADWMDTACARFRASLWGKALETSDACASESQNHGYGRGISESPVTHWKLFQTWSVDLDHLIPLTPEMNFNLSSLPPNALLFKFDDPEQIYMCDSEISSQPSTPGNLSWSENNSLSIPRENDAGEALNRDRTVISPRKSLRELKVKRSAGWQDLISLLFMQTSLLDTKENLQEMVGHCNKLIFRNKLCARERETTSIAEQIYLLKQNLSTCHTLSIQVANDIGAKRKKLELRRENLQSARVTQFHISSSLVSYGSQISELQKHQTDLARRVAVRRGLLFSSLCFAFPIDLLSASDLLFTILDIPMPIPIMPSDPAPPLILPSLPRYNEEYLACALGHVAQVVQLSAAYLRLTLPYPITCVGTRSTIKDIISLMMGPRKFPLYSRGVDAYRFEYAVYLLNKNIEMLMSSHELKAMDMRHTLPNLKNLLLTLSSGQDFKLMNSRHT